MSRKLYEQHDNISVENSQIPSISSRHFLGFYPKKNMPLIFDDSFVSYDDQRLARILSWLSKQGFEQILIFSCQHREMNLMDRMGLEYHSIYL